MKNKPLFPRLLPFTKFLESNELRETFLSFVKSLSLLSSLEEWMYLKEKITAQAKTLCSAIKKRPKMCHNEPETIKKHFSTLVRKKIGWDKGKELPSRFISRYINKSTASSTIRSYSVNSGPPISSMVSIENAITSQFSDLYRAFDQQMQPYFPSSIRPLSLASQDSLSLPITQQTSIK
eukprot:TRINITY_DN6487_c1_g5_i2.p1 TRINITY_DN6487_c1_g5~~TRINITY_DN6487_c1_g5_i2.p1  ORF type:complete len:179 (+),score=12.60 TRINITY_DN6487_c1_g5_i2:171-707(+)